MQPNDVPAEIDHAAIALSERYLEMQARGGTGAPNDDQNVTSLWLLSTPFEDATPDNLLPLPRHEVPDDMPTAQRLAMRVTSITGHGEQVVLLVHLDGDDARIRRIDSDGPLFSTESIIRKRLIDPKPVAANDNPPQAAADAKQAVKSTLYVLKPAHMAPRRQLLYARHYARKYLTATIAAGGSGKSANALVEAIAMSTVKTHTTI